MAPEEIESRWDQDQKTGGVADKHGIEKVAMFTLIGHATGGAIFVHLEKRAKDRPAQTDWTALGQNSQ